MPQGILSGSVILGFHQLKTLLFNRLFDLLGVPPFNPHFVQLLSLRYLIKRLPGLRPLG